MTPEMTTGLFTVLGTLIAAVATYWAAKMGHSWEKAKSTIDRLCEEVAAYHTLEDLYTKEVSDLDGSQGHPRTIMDKMRKRVDDISDVKRPRMTYNEARKIQEFWA